MTGFFNHYPPQNLHSVTGLYASIYTLSIHRDWEVIHMGSTPDLSCATLFAQNRGWTSRTAESSFELFFKK
jgi:hypothetical protein